MSRKLDEYTQQFRLPGIRTFESLMLLTGWPKTFPEDGNGKMEDLPQNIQDGVYAAMERMSTKVGLPLAIVAVRMDTDPDIPEGQDGHIFLHVIASEVVAINMRGTRH